MFNIYSQNIAKLFKSEIELALKNRHEKSKSKKKMKIKESCDAEGEKHVLLISPPGEGPVFMSSCLLFSFFFSSLVLFFLFFLSFFFPFLFPFFFSFVLSLSFFFSLSSLFPFLWGARGPGSPQSHLSPPLHRGGMVA